ncbi:hypothetical protein KBZ13_09945 [Cyanobium sp. ATX 6F1]|nr:hypothetical protein [Cyanobium sp. ATX 6F1]
MLASLFRRFMGYVLSACNLEHLDRNLMLRWFVNLSSDDAICNPIMFTKNRDRLPTQ